MILMCIRAGEITHDFIHTFFAIPLGADKMGHISNWVFSVFLNDKNKNYDTVRSAWEFATNRDQPEVCSFIRLEVTLL